MTIKQARGLLREYCKPVNHLNLIQALADERGIPRGNIQPLIDSGEYGIGEYLGIWMIRKSKLYVPTIPKDKLGIDKNDLINAVSAIDVFSHELSADLKDLNWQSTLCPFHDERNPSFRVNIPEGRFVCKGCGESGGNVIDFIMQLHNMTFPQAITYLAERYTNIRTDKCE